MSTTTTKQPFKYLTHYPFSILTVAKSHNIVLYIISLVIWQNTLPMEGFILTILPIFDILNTAIAVISLWFTVQKFYWKKVEISLNVSAAVISFIAMIIVIFHHNIDRTLSFTHLFCFFSWLFCCYWSVVHTSNNVSNLFISEWGQATTDIEIEALQEHF